MTKKKKTEKKSGPCTYPKCKTICNEGDFCYGCASFVCETHSTNCELPWGGHNVDAHWTEEEADDY